MTFAISAASAAQACAGSRPRMAMVSTPRAARVARPSVRARAAAATAERPATGLPYDRVFNFSAGPACLPVEVIEQAQRELLNWHGSGMSVMEMSHRGKEFTSIIQKAEADLRALLAIPDEYEVLFFQGGASLQFAAIPLNLASGPEDVADYVVTGAWSKKAAGEAKRFTTVNVAAEGDGKSVPEPSTWKLTEGSKYVHFCSNETIGGVELTEAPALGDRVLVADMSSDFLSRPVDVSKYGLIYAGAQKNVGPAGVTIVIVRKDLLGSFPGSGAPSYLDYAKAAKEGSMANTPPCFSIYVCGLVFAHMLRAGGLEATLKHNEVKAKVLYDAIDRSNGFYSAPVDVRYRSLMNVPFTIPSKPELEAVFIKEAAARGMGQLKGHRSVGGMRASIYNSMPIEGVRALASYMAEFAKANQ